MPQRKKLIFPGQDGISLAGLLETPDAEPISTVLFAHCFTCGKDIAAASRIARALVARGHQVLRFDFTGLGSSDGDFANTSFSSNVGDLLAAADFLREQENAPGLLIGHSLGGTAVLNAAHHIPECRGVVTIGSPADAQHVSKQFACDIEKIEEQGEAEVLLAGRKFTIRKQFIDDIRQTDTDHIKNLKPALLVMHSPVDTVVDITQAERIYRAAKHPKSFISLGDADHLLSKATDAEYVSSVVAAWCSRFVDAAPKVSKPKLAKGEVQVTEHDHAFALDVHSDDHHWVADEPASLGGKNTGPDPYEQLLAALGSCTAMTLRMYARRKGLALDDVSVIVRHEREHLSDCEGCEETPKRLDVLTRSIKLSGDLDEATRQRLVQIADLCPVHKTLEGDIDIRTALE